MKQTALITLLFTGVMAGLFYVGGYVLLIGLGVIGLTVIILLSFIAGAKVAHKLITDGANLAIQSASNNDKHDAAKIQALAGLTREAMKAKSLPAGNDYPALPHNVFDGSFVIAGLEEELD